MEEIKSSFKPIDRLIESFIEPVYIVKYLNSSNVGKKIYTNKYGFTTFESLHVCSSMKIAENKIREILNTELKKLYIAEQTYIEHISCGNKCSKSTKSEHKLLEYMDFIITKDKYGNNEYNFDKLKENCTYDISVEIVKRLLDNYAKDCRLEVIKTELLI